MWQNLKNFIKNIQNSDEAVKKRWLIGLSAVSIILVIGLWLMSFNFTAEKITAAEQKSAEVGFWQIFKTGLTITVGSALENVEKLFSKIADEIKKQKVITIE